MTNDLDMLKAELKWFACFCCTCDLPEVDEAQHHPDCQSARLVEHIRNLIKEVEILRVGDKLHKVAIQQRDAAWQELERVKTVLEYYADRNVWRDNQIDSDDCSAVTVYGSHVSLDFTEIVGGKRAREALGDEQQSH